MIAEKTKAAVTAAVESELKNCTAVYDYQYHSMHEAANVMYEEMLETNIELRKVIDGWNRLQRCVFDNDAETAIEIAKQIEENAVKAMCEAAQVAACAKKLQRGTVI